MVEITGENLQHGDWFYSAPIEKQEYDPHSWVLCYVEEVNNNELTITRAPSELTHGIPSEDWIKGVLFHKSTT